jgi:hypothetical protein
MGKFREGQNNWLVDKIPPEIAERVRKALDKLRDGGSEFEYLETPDEFVVKLANPLKEIHFNKMDPFPLKHGNIIEHVPLEDAIKARIINPDGSIRDTINSPQFNKKEK